MSMTMEEHVVLRFLDMVTIYSEKTFTLATRNIFLGANLAFSCNANYRWSDARSDLSRSRLFGDAPLPPPEFLAVVLRAVFRVGMEALG